MLPAYFTEAPGPFCVSCILIHTYMGLCNPGAAQYIEWSPFVSCKIEGMLLNYLRFFFTLKELWKEALVEMKIKAKASIIEVNITFLIWVSKLVFQAL